MMKLIMMPFALNPEPIIAKTYFICSSHFPRQPAPLN
jgi:hypothetical protein